MKVNKTIRIFNRATAIVTGAASGIGCGLAEELAKRGCDMVLADRQIELAEEVASKICASGGKARASKVDVTDFTAVEKLVQETVARMGRLDYIFNNAGIGIGGGKYGKMLIDLSPGQHRQMLEMIEKFKPISPNVFAKKALNSVAKNKAIIVVPAWWKLFWLLNRLFPSMGIHLVGKSFQKMQKRFGFAEQN